MEKSVNIQSGLTDTSNKIHIATLMQESGIGFGTSGARGRVNNMTDQVCYAYTGAFLQHLEAQRELSTGEKIGIAGDLRDSTPRIINAVAAAITDKGYR